MKLINFKQYGQWDTQSFLKQVINVKVGGMMLDEMRQRLALSKKFDDTAAHHVIVTDDEFKMIEQPLKTAPFYTVAHEHLLALVDDVLASKEPPVVMLRNGKDKDKTKGAQA